jgi:hypothetical protein
VFRKRDVLADGRLEFADLVRILDSAYRQARRWRGRRVTALRVDSRALPWVDELALGPTERLDDSDGLVPGIADRCHPDRHDAPLLDRENR